MMERGRKEEAVRVALDALTLALEAFARAYAAWAAAPDSPDAGARLAAAETEVSHAREALDALERAMDEHR